LLALSRPRKREGEAQQATKDRVAAMDALDEWMSDFVAIARIHWKRYRSFLRYLAFWNPPRTNPPLGLFKKGAKGRLCERSKAISSASMRLLHPAKKRGIRKDVCWFLGQPQGLLHLSVQSILEQKKPIF